MVCVEQLSPFWTVARGLMIVAPLRRGLEKNTNEQRVPSMEQLVFLIVANGHAGVGDAERHSTSFDAHRAGGALARSEATRMVTEKVQALGEAQAVAAVGSMTGRNRRHIAKKVAGGYKKRVRGNRRRLTR
jgi:hypothetical protein